ncbi:hypothetical protein B0O99DRAFT_677898 [Bisporella sp. PMI_857]|nr:hypothetical protein B0O99DRAFT_677898 [Bisporella sp. PMI_857]
MAPLMTYVPAFLAVLSALPTLSLAVELRQYFSYYSNCRGGTNSYYRCTNIASGTCCGTSQDFHFWAYSCVGCARYDTHAVFTRGGANNCGGSLLAARTGANPNCILLEDFPSADGHRWCRACSAREGRLVDTASGTEVKCQGSVEPDTLTIEGRSFNLTAMSLAEKHDLGQLAAQTGPDIPVGFNTHEIQVEDTSEDEETFI